MNCPGEAVWISYLDREPDEGESDRLSNHLERCTDCQDRVFGLVELSDFTQTALKTGGIQAEVIPSRQRRPELRRRWGVAAAGAAVVLAAVTGVGPHRVLAALANTFQMNQLQTVTLNQQDFFTIENQLNQNGKVDLKQFGSVQVKHAPNAQPQPSISLSKAYQLSGLPQVWPVASAPSGIQANIQSAATLVIVPKVAAINRLIRMEGGHQLFPQALNNQPVTLYIPQQMNVYNQSLDVMEMRMPTLTVPNGVSVNQVAAAIASLPFLPPNVRQSLLAIHDWKQTLILPVGGKVSRVSIQGRSAVLSQSPNNLQLMWVNHGVLVQIGDYGKNASAPQLLARVRQWLQ